MGRAIRGEPTGVEEDPLKKKIAALKSGTLASAAEIIIEGGPHEGNLLELGLVSLAEELNTQEEISAAVDARLPKLKIG